MTIKSLSFVISLALLASCGKGNPIAKNPEKFVAAVDHYEGGNFLRIGTIANCGDYYANPEEFEKSGIIEMVGKDLINKSCEKGMEQLAAHLQKEAPFQAITLADLTSKTTWQTYFATKKKQQR